MSEYPAEQPSNAERELATSRLLDATREQVFAAISDPARLARWWGPKDFTNTFEICDFKPGGKWQFTMHSPQGGNFPNRSVFAVIEPNVRVVIRHESTPRFALTITLETVGSQTQVGWRQLFETDDECRRIAKIALTANEQNLDRLAAEVAQGS